MPEPLPAAPVPSPPSPAPVPPRRFGCLHLLLAVAAAVVLTALAAVLAVRIFLFPAPFKPVALNAREEQILQAKLDRLDFGSPAAATAPTAPAPLEPEAYAEARADRTIRFTEHELNALVAKNTDLADKLAIDLADNLVSAKLLIPLDEDFPVFGGKTLKVKTGVAFRYANGRPVVMLRGVSVMGVPLPNAWLGGLKNVDVMREFGGDAGFWKTFADGIENLRIADGQLELTLKE